MSQKGPGTADFQATMEIMYKGGILLYVNGLYYISCYIFGYVIECGLKYLLQRYGINASGNPYSLEDITKMSHIIDRLTGAVANITNLPNTLRTGLTTKCKYICLGSGGYPPWNPKYRYGEHPMWGTKDWCTHYKEEADYFYNELSTYIGGKNDTF